MARQEPSGAHIHAPAFETSGVGESRKVSDDLRPLVAELNRIIDRLEVLAGIDADKGGRGDEHAGGR